MSIILIAAVAQNGVVGKSGGIPWKLSSDLQHFQNQTLGHNVIMGRKTFESIKSKPLKHRTNIVVSQELSVPNLTETSLERALWKAQAHGGNTFIIGGERLWKEGLYYADRMIISHVDVWIDQGDAFFPYINSRIWTDHHREFYEKNLSAGDDHKFIVTHYRRK